MTYVRRKSLVPMNGNSWTMANRMSTTSSEIRAKPLVLEMRSGTERSVFITHPMNERVF